MGVPLLALTAAAVGGYRRDIRAARARLAGIPSEVFPSPYGDIEYLLQGEGEDPVRRGGLTVLVSHGITGGVDHGLRLAGEWNVLGAGRRYLFVSRFGYLRSTMPQDASARLQAAAYSVLLDYLGIDRVTVFGNSAGGPSAMWFAIDYPERTAGLILHSSAAPGQAASHPPRFVFESDLAYWAAIKAAPDLLLGLLLPAPLRATLTDRERQRLLEDVYLAGLPISERAQGVVFDYEVSNPSANEIPLERIGVPTLILQAVDDPRERAGGQALAERIPGSEFVGLTGGHFLLRQEDRVRAEIDRFVSGSPARHPGQ